MEEVHLMFFITPSVSPVTVYMQTETVTFVTCVPGEKPEVRIVSCGADKSIYFQTTEQVSLNSVSVFCFDF